MSAEALIIAESRQDVMSKVVSGYHDADVELRNSGVTIHVETWQSHIPGVLADLDRHVTLVREQLLALAPERVIVPGPPVQDAP